MTESVGNSTISEKMATAVNWASVISAISGIALVILAETAAHGLHTRALYFYAPGAALVGLCLIGIVTANCCCEEPGLSPELGHRKSPVKGIHPAENESSKTTIVPPTGGEETKDRAPPDSKGKAVTAGSEGAADFGSTLETVNPFFPSITSHTQYQQVVSYECATLPDGSQMMLHPLQKVSTIFTIDSVWKQMEPSKIDPTQKTYLQQHYHYQVVKGEGDCFYISLLSGFLHNMLVANIQDVGDKASILRELTDEANRFEDLNIHKLTEKANPGRCIKTSSIETVAKLINDITNLETLVAFLTNDDKVDTVVLFLRMVAYRRVQGSTDKLKMRDWAKMDEAQSMLSMFSSELAITPEYDDYTTLASTNSLNRIGVFSEQERLQPFLVLHRPSHYDVLLNKEVLARLSISEASSGGAAESLVSKSK